MNLDEFIECVGDGRIPPSPPDHQPSLSIDPQEWSRQHHIRDDCVRNGMWGIVTLDWTAKLADWIDGRKVLEIMSGRGWLAKALRHHGVDLIATDNHSSHGQWRGHGNNKKVPALTDIMAKECSQAIKSYGKHMDILLCSWPPMDSSMTKATRRWGTEKPIIYIGESDWGCNADGTFWCWFDGEPDEEIIIPQWDGLHDQLYIGHCRKEAKTNGTNLLDS